MSRRHGSTSNLHEVSPQRLESQSYHNSSQMRGGRSRAEPTNADHSPVVVSRGGHPQCNKMEMEEFVKLVKDVIFTEREVESAKIELALKSDFNITDAFN